MTGEASKKADGEARGHGVGGRKSLKKCKPFEKQTFLAATSKNTYIVDIFDHSTG